MQHPIRVYDPQFLHEITLRINGGDYLLNMNCRSLRRLVQGFLAKYALKYSIKVIAFHFLSNHYHGLFGIPSASMFVRFLTAFHSSMALLINSRRNKSGHVWSENLWYPVAQDPVTVAHRISYIMNQAVAANLADHPIQFPGPSSNEWMIDGAPVLGVVFDATKKYRDSQLKAGAKPDEEYYRIVEVPMAPPPCWADLSEEHLRELYRGLADEAAKVPLAVLREARSEVPPPPEPPPQPAEPAPQPEELNQPPDPRQCQEPEITPESFLADLERRRLAEKICIINRVDALGRPYSPPGKVKRKERRPRSEERIWILCADDEFRAEYGRLYLELVEVYRAAKSAWHTAAQVTPGGLHAGGFQLPPHTLVGSMPLVD